jgi:hypothetical protein
MTLEQFTEKLHEAGWTSPNDAQHEKIKSVYEEFSAIGRENLRLRQVDNGRAATYTAAMEKIYSLEKENAEMKRKLFWIKRTIAE